MFCNDNMRREDFDINITNQNLNFNDNMNDNMNYNEMGMMPMQQQMPTSMGDMMMPIVEPGRERIVNRTFVHEVPHICPFM